MHIGTVCTRQVVTCLPNTSVLEAAKIMRNQHVGDLVIIEESGDNTLPIGIVTDRDLVVEVMAKEISPLAMDVGDLMSRSLVVAYEGEEIDVAMMRMKKAGVRRVPVVDSGGLLVGIVTLDDIIATQDLALGDISHLARSQNLDESHRLR